MRWTLLFEPFLVPVRHRLSDFWFVSAIATTIRARNSPLEIPPISPRGSPRVSVKAIFFVQLIQQLITLIGRLIDLFNCSKIGFLRVGTKI